MCGSDDLNRGLAEYVYGLLAPQKVELEKDGKSLEHIIERDVITKFESSFKRNYRSADESKSFSFPISGLKESAKDSRLRKGGLVLTM